MSCAADLRESQLFTEKARENEIFFCRRSTNKFKRSGMELLTKPQITVEWLMLVVEAYLPITEKRAFKHLNISALRTE